MDRIDTGVELEDEWRYEGPCGDLAGAIATEGRKIRKTERAKEKERETDREGEIDREREDIPLKGGAVAPAAKSLMTDPNTGRQLSCWSLCLIFVKEKK